MSLTFKIVNGDVQIGASTGRPMTLSGKDKFSQDVRENLDSKVQSDGTGADLDGVIGLAGDVFSLRTEMSRRIIDSFSAYGQAQKNIQRGDRLPEERFNRIAQVIVLPIRGVNSGEFDQTSYSYRVDVLSDKSGSTTSVTGVLVQ